MSNRYLGKYTNFRFVCKVRQARTGNDVRCVRNVRGENVVRKVRRARWDHLATVDGGTRAHAPLRVWWRFPLVAKVRMGNDVRNVCREFRVRRANRGANSANDVREVRKDNNEWSFQQH